MDEMLMMLSQITPEHVLVDVLESYCKKYKVAQNEEEKKKAYAGLGMAASLVLAKDVMSNRTPQELHAEMETIRTALGEREGK